jgi:hypothetical protein
VNNQPKAIALTKKKRQLVLLSEADQIIKLPPLRLDDVVTVSRNVYDHGEAPSFRLIRIPKSPGHDSVPLGYRILGNPAGAFEGRHDAKRVAELMPSTLLISARGFGSFSTTKNRTMDDM